MQKINFLVHFNGYIDKTKLFTFITIRVYVFPSIDEGFGIPLIEVST